jgi:predicted CopG family antitoxin
MSVKTVTLSEDAYLVLAARKRDGESFSEVVRRLARAERSLKEFVGGWEDVPEDRLAPYQAWMRESDSASRSEMSRLGARRRGR